MASDVSAISPEKKPRKQKSHKRKDKRKIEGSTKYFFKSISIKLYHFKILTATLFYNSLQILAP